MRRTLIVLATLVPLGAAVYSAAASFREEEAAPPGAGDGRAHARIVTAPGAVEPLSEEIAVGAEVAGKLERVTAEEGDRVRAGDVVAVLVNRDYAAQVASARATLQAREAALRRVVNGARHEERREAQAEVEAAEAVLAHALAVRDRRRQLLEQGAISREEAESAEQAWLVAQARARAAAERAALVAADAREEDEAEAAAAVAMARAAVAQAEAMLAKTFVRSPIDGVVLRRHHHPGETVLNAPVDPIVTVGDLSRLRVRAEIDELDVAEIRPGQQAYVRADAFGDRRFAAVVSKVGPALGKKHVRTEEPAERVDSKVLEVLLDLEQPDGLRPRLRVDVFIDAGEDRHAAE